MQILVNFENGGTCIHRCPLDAMNWIMLNLYVLKRSVLKHRYNYAKGYMGIEFYDPHFVLKKAKTTFCIRNSSANSVNQTSNVIRWIP